MLNFKTERYIGKHNFYVAEIGNDIIIKVCPVIPSETYWIMEITTPDGKKLGETRFPNNTGIPKEEQFAAELCKIGQQRIKRWNEIMEKLQKTHDQNVKLWNHIMEQTVKDNA